SNPRILGEGIAPASLTPSVRALPHERTLDLDIVYTDGELYNPATGLKDKVRLRSYNGKEVDPDAPYVSPTIEAVPGDTIYVNLHNQLPPDPSCSTGHSNPNAPHCFNGTNLHTHGLWVNPAGNGDNVLLSINPGVEFQYEYKIPGGHPAGTFWYHTHRHGSTAIQVSSGMAGALIIRGDREPTATTPGDLDTLLDGLPDRVLVFQQIQYACRGAPTPDNPLGPIKTDPVTGAYICADGDVGTIEGYDQLTNWPKSGRYTSINGLVLPTFKATQGQLERWRMIHGGVRDTISLRIVKMRPSAQLAATMSQAQAQTFIQESCNDAGITHYRVAADGLTLAQVQASNLTVFQPGYRWDEAVMFPEVGRYCLIDASSPAAGSVNGDSPNPSLLGFVDVEEGTPVSNLTTSVVNALVAQAEANLPDIAPVVVADLKAGLKLSKFVPHPDIAESEVTGTQELTFNIRSGPTSFEVSSTADRNDSKPYDPSRLDRALKLGGVDEWTLYSAAGSHPFHIHVNPFQVVSILDPNGKDVSVWGVPDEAGGKLDTQYSGLKGAWKDTLWVKGGYKITVRTRYERYIGAFVLHCHILDHEDKGMMQNVAIVLPDGDISATAAGAPPLQLQQDHMHTKKP
ncbi:MAG TPA: multicopper oxidase family protein, partial [Inquilinus sp.]